MRKLLLLAVAALACAAVPAHATTETAYLQTASKVTYCQVQGSGWTEGVYMQAEWKGQMSGHVFGGSISAAPSPYGTQWQCLNGDQAAGTYLETSCPCSAQITTEPTVTENAYSPYQVYTKLWLIVGNCSGFNPQY